MITYLEVTDLESWGNNFKREREQIKESSENVTIFKKKNRFIRTFNIIY